MMSWVEFRALSSLCRCQGATPQLPGPRRPAAGTVVARSSKEWNEMWWRDEEGQVWRVEGERADCRASLHILVLFLSVDIHSY